MTEPRQMPRYKCHKEVYALKIGAIEFHGADGATVTPADREYALIRTSDGWRERYRGVSDHEDGETDLGYYVVYEDGYASWSPAKAFEEGYELMRQ